ncbi:exopolygalacturonase-like [Cynara cardunculus var. scolymus]|uniref:exopolygalacturonase-like n=1 Tax=Cynara cardunculus var. scolymus TaxID=59895 RepID=UPI000D628E4C|nr:exopolygalacturonase-like [Cynara cardunculus var. scolymus]
MGGSPSISFFFYFIGFFITTTTAVTVDIKTKGAVADGKANDAQAIMDAWKEACGSKDPSQVVIPSGNYLVASPVSLVGPCQNPIEVVAEGATLLAPTDPKAIKTESWFHIKNVNKMTLTGGNFDGQGEEAWKTNNAMKTGKIGLPYNIRMDLVKDSTIRGITSRNSKQVHIQVINCDNTVIEKAIIDAPAESLNTDGIHIGRTNGFKIVGTTIKTGDDCISIGDGSKNIHVEKTTCGPGHGFSIGSLGRYPGEEPVDGIFFLGCSISNSDNGLRIKTWPGSLPGVANQLHFEDIIMENVGNPILIDQEYCPYLDCHPEVPSKVKISDVLFKGIRGTSMTKYAITILCSKELQCDKVVLQDIDLKYEGKEGPGAVSGCHNVKPQVIGNVVPQPCTAPPDLFRQTQKGFTLCFEFGEEKKGKENYFSIVFFQEKEKKENNCYVLE